MTPLDERLIDPRPGVLVKLLVAATKKANSRLQQRRLEKGATEWERFVRRQRGKREGHQEYQGGYGAVPAARVEVSWWTDPIGRRHWRVVGRRFEFAGNSAPPAMFAAHPLWHVYPDRLLVRQVGERSDLLAVCACGAAGRPAEIGWVGERCGPCHDRIEEDLPPLPPGLPAHEKLHKGIVSQVAFAGTGQLVTCGADGQVIAWGYDGGERRGLLPRYRGTFTGLAASPSGVVAVGLGSGRVWLGDLDGGPWRKLTLQVGYLGGLLLSPDGTRLFVNGTQGDALIDVESEGASPLRLPAQGYLYAQWMPDGSGLVLHDTQRGVLHLDLATSQEVLLRPESLEDYQDFLDQTVSEESYSRAMAVSPDGRWLAAEGAWDGSVGVHLCDLSSGEWRPLLTVGSSPGIRALRFTPDGRLALAEADGGVRLWDAATRKLEGTLFPAPMPGWPSVRAFSADGDLLAIADLTGRVSVWPWRRLLGC